jgi:hypothetical protein
MNFEHSIFKIQNSEKGISIMISVLMLSFILTIALGINLILIRQVKVMREVGYSVIALYAADAGVENTLYKNKLCSSPMTCSTSSPGICKSDCSGLETDYATSTVFSNGAGYGVTLSGNGTTTIKSVGNYESSRRAIEARIY